MSEKQFKLSSEAVLQFQIMEDDTFLNENEVVDLLNIQSKLISAYQYEFLKMRKENEQLEKEKEYYREYALRYLKEFPIYSDSFIETMQGIEGDGFAIKMLRDRNEIIDALKREGLYE